MAARRTRAGAGIPWPGFVDAMTALVMVMMFVLTIFMVVQFTLREQLSGKDDELEKLGAQISEISGLLALERDNAASAAAAAEGLRASLRREQSEAERLDALVAAITAERDAAAGEAGALRDRAAALIAARDAARSETEAERAARVSAEAEAEQLQSANARALTEAEALRAALASLRAENAAEAETARLAAARADAMAALAETLRAEKQALEAAGAEQAATLEAAERDKLLERAAAQALRDKLAASDAELDAMTLALEEERRRAEDTLTLLAAAQRAETTLSEERDAARGALSREQALLQVARATISEGSEATAAQARRVAALNAQTRELRAQIAALQETLGAAKRAEAEADIQLENLGRDLNAALAREAQIQRAEAQLQKAEAELQAREAEYERREAERLAAEAERLREENQDLAGYRSEFFGRMRAILAGRDDVRIVGDRFVFQSEVLFDTGSAALGGAGAENLAQLATALNEVIPEIPEGIDWVLRVDGHTDARGDPGYNYELSFNRALSVVDYLVREGGLPADRFAPTGFGEFRPLVAGDSDDAFARNRRIEVKFTER